MCTRVARWALLLEEFEYVIEHRSGKKMLHVDALSRNPLPSTLLISESEDTIIARIRKAQEDNVTRKIFQLAEHRVHDNYVVKNGLLYKETDDDILLVLPRSLQPQIVRQAHESGHFAVEKTKEIIRRDY